MSLMEKEIYEFGPFLLDPAEHMLSCEGHPVSLTPKAFETLVCLVRNQGRMLTKDELLKQIWPDTFVEEVNLAVNISTVRKALGENPQDCRFIATIPGRGYRFVAEVRKIADQNGEDSNRQILSAPTTLKTTPDAEALHSRTETDQDASRNHNKSGFEWLRSFRDSALKMVIATVFALLGVALIGLHFWHSRSQKIGTQVTVPSIAVLPFADLSANKDQAYISDGLSEELINDLAQVPGLKVVARSSSFQCKEKNEDLRSVGSKLGVANILEGSIRREGDRIRIRAELTTAEDGFELWSQTYDRKIGDLLNVEEQIARAATDALQVKLLGPKASTSATIERSRNPEAYVAYLRAQYFTSRGRDKDDLDSALAYVEQAIKMDEKYARAWALRSYIVDTMADGGLMEPETGFRRAREDAERAIEIDPNGAAGYLALAWVQINRDWNWEGAELSLNKASELEPGGSAILRYRSFLCELRGQLKQAIDFHEQAMVLEPLLASSQSYMAWLLYSAGEYEKANDATQRALELNPKKTHDHLTRGQILLAQGHAQDALAEMEREPGV